MTKIVVNNSHSSFRLSLLASSMLHHLGFPMVEAEAGTWDNEEEEEHLVDVDLPGYQGHPDFGYIIYKGVRYYVSHGENRDIMRSHPLLVKVVELLGPAASSGYSRLAVREIPDGTPYRIKEYDGAEGVEVLDLNNYVQGFENSDVPVPKTLLDLAQKTKEHAEANPKNKSY